MPMPIMTHELPWFGNGSKNKPKNKDFWLWGLGKPIYRKSCELLLICKEVLDSQFSKTVEISFAQPVVRELSLKNHHNTI